MAEKELRKEIDEITEELAEVKGELDIRIAGIKKKIKPALLVVAGLIGLKIGLKIMKGIFGLFWKLKSLLAAAVLLFVLQLYLASTKTQVK